MNEPDSIDYLSLGMAAFEEQRYGDAADAWRKAFIINPQNIEASWKLGMLLNALGQWHDAAGVWSVHIESNAAHGQAWQFYAIALHKLGRLPEAASAFRRALELDSTLETSRHGLRELRSQDAAIRDSDRLLILDPGLIDMGGHHFNYDNSLLQAARRRGLEARLHGLRETVPDIASALSVTPTFRVSMYKPLHLGSWASQSAREYQNFLIMNRYIFEDLARINDHIRADDVLFFHSINHKQLLGIAQWLQSLPEFQRPRSVILLRYWEIVAPNADDVENLYRLCFSLIAHPRLRVRLCSDTRELCILYSHLARKAVDLVPIPHMPGPPSSHSLVPIDRQGPVIGYIGIAASIKGFEFLPGLIAKLRDEKLPFHFLIQLSQHGYPPDVLRREGEKIGAILGDDITFIQETVSEQRFHEMVHACDIVMVAYDPTIYRYGSSGICTEALVAGKVVIIPDDTAIASQARSLGAGFCAFKSHTLESVWSALRRAVTEYPALAVLAAEASQRASQTHTPDRLLAYLMEDDL